MPIEIEPMQESDLDAVLRIEQASFRHPWKRNFFVADFNHPYAWMLVAREAGQLLGYTIAWHIEDEMHLANIAVDAARRRAGVGDALLALLIEMGREIGCKVIYLEVRPSNTAARSFYAKHGFSFSYTRRAYYPDKEDALVLVRDLG
jgi:[ribosomal protein S18]-alanine N-acetyltransferase